MKKCQSTGAEPNRPNWVTPYVEGVTFLWVLGLGNWVKLYKAISGLNLDFMILQRMRIEKNHW